MKSIASLLILGLLFSGCEDTPRIYNADYTGGAIHLGNNFYVKKMSIQGVHALIQCDKDGNIIPNANIQTTNTSGKITTQVSTITPLGTKIPSKGKYTFSCDTLIECEQQISIVKQSLGE